MRPANGIQESFLGYPHRTGDAGYGQTRSSVTTSQGYQFAVGMSCRALGQVLRSVIQDHRVELLRHAASSWRARQGDQD